MNKSNNCGRITLAVFALTVIPFSWAYSASPAEVRQQQESQQRAQQLAQKQAQLQAQLRAQQEAQRHAQQQERQRAQQEAQRQAQQQAREQQEAQRQAQQQERQRAQQEVQRHAQEQAQAQREAQRQAQQQEQRHAQQEAQRQAQQQTKAQQEAQLRAQLEQKQAQLAQLKAQERAQERAQAEREAQRQSQQQAKSQQEAQLQAQLEQKQAQLAQLKAQERAKAEREAQSHAQQQTKAQQEAQLRAQLEQKQAQLAQLKAQERAKAEREAQSHAQQQTKAQQEAQLRAQLEQKQAQLAQLKAQERAKAEREAQQQAKAQQEVQPKPEKLTSLNAISTARPPVNQSVTTAGIASPAPGTSQATATKEQTVKTTTGTNTSPIISADEKANMEAKIARTRVNLESPPPPSPKSVLNSGPSIPFIGSAVNFINSAVVRDNGQQQIWETAVQEKNFAKLEVNKAEQALKAGDINGYTRYMNRAQVMTKNADDGFAAAANVNAKAIDNAHGAAKAIQQTAFITGDIVAEFGGTSTKTGWKIVKGGAQTLESMGENGIVGGLLDTATTQTLSYVTGKTLNITAPLNGGPVKSVQTLFAQSGPRLWQAVGNVALDWNQGLVEDRSLVLAKGITSTTLEAIQKRP